MPTSCSHTSVKQLTTGAYLISSHSWHSPAIWPSLAERGWSSWISASLFTLVKKIDCQRTPPVQYLYPSRTRRRLWSIITPTSMSARWSFLQTKPSEGQLSTSFSSLAFSQRDDIYLSSVQKHNKPLVYLRHPHAKVVVVKKYHKRLPACPFYVQRIGATSPRHEHRVVRLQDQDLLTIPSMRTDAAPISIEWWSERRNLCGMIFSHLEISYRNIVGRKHGTLTR